MAVRDNVDGQYGDREDISALILSRATLASACTSPSTLWLMASIVNTRIRTIKSPSVTVRRVPYQSSKRRRNDRGFARSKSDVFCLSILTSHCHVPAHVSSFIGEACADSYHNVAFILYLIPSTVRANSFSGSSQVHLR